MPTNIKHSSKSREWYTPSVFTDLAREVMGEIELDPASTSLAQGWINAKKYFTIADDGLNRNWSGKVWLNPPYGRNTKLWIEKLMRSYFNGEVTEAITLVIKFFLLSESPTKSLNAI